MKRIKTLAEEYKNASKKIFFVFLVWKNLLKKKNLQGMAQHFFLLLTKFPYHYKFHKKQKKFVGNIFRTWKVHMWFLKTSYKVCEVELVLPENDSPENCTKIR
jgi:hypothetical protein